MGFIDQWFFTKIYDGLQFFAWKKQTDFLDRKFNDFKAKFIFAVLTVHYSREWTK